MVGGAEKVGTGVRSVCHRGVINTRWGRSKGGREREKETRASEREGRNCKPRVPDTTCYYF